MPPERTRQETLGGIHLADGRPAEAVGCYSRAIDVWRVMRADTDLADARAEDVRHLLTTLSERRRDS